MEQRSGNWTRRDKRDVFRVDECPVTIGSQGLIDLRRSCRKSRIPLLGQKVEVQVLTVTGVQEALEFIIDKVSNAFVLLHDLISFEAPTAPIKPRQISKPVTTQPIRHPVKSEYGWCACPASSYVILFAIWGWIRRRLAWTLRIM